MDAQAGGALSGQVNGLDEDQRKKMRGAKPKYKFLTAEEAVAHRCACPQHCLGHSPRTILLSSVICAPLCPAFRRPAVWTFLMCRRERNRTTALASYERRKARDNGLKAEVRLAWHLVGLCHG